MIEDVERNMWVSRPIGCAVGALTVALGLSFISADCRAAGPSNRTRVIELPALLASSNVLPEAAMARQTGTGLRPPAIIANEPTSSPRVLLWDELRLGPLMAPANSGLVTSGTPGK
jgi:hypothetical protein